MDPVLLVELCTRHDVALVHPGYGFLSESAEFSARLQEAGIVFVGPSPETLEQTGDKLSARRLAENCGVPVLPALIEPVEDVETLRAFAHEVGLPVMIKAVDGGGGRGIRLVRQAHELENSLVRAMNESPSGEVFVEKAVVSGYKHVEVQILGDGTGNVRHYWERECSIQRKFQKIVEVAPSNIADRSLVSAVIECAVRMAKAIKYSSLGTWEFLVSEERSAFYFMEINPRLQVEHTVTEAICGIDLVRMQILMAMQNAGMNLGPHAGVVGIEVPKPTASAIQLRITAEDPQHNFSASIGRVRQVVFPGGNGLRVDSHLRPGVTVGTEFDSLLAKLVITGQDWPAAVVRASRALEDVVVEGVITNIALLQFIISSPEFRAGNFDTQWFEETLRQRSELPQAAQQHANPSAFLTRSQASIKSAQPSDQLVKKGDQFDVQVVGEDGTAVLASDAMRVSSIARNDFPNSLALKLSSPGPAGQSYILKVSKQVGAPQGLGTEKGHAGSATSGLSSHLVCPIAGQLVEVLVDDGDAVSEGEAVVIVRQMKMELEVRAHRSGVISSLFDHEEGADVAPGTIICSIASGDKERL